MNDRGPETLPVLRVREGEGLGRQQLACVLPGLQLLYSMEEYEGGSDPDVEQEVRGSGPFMSVLRRGLQTPRGVQKGQQPCDLQDVWMRHCMGFPQCQRIIQGME